MQIDLEPLFIESPIKSPPSEIPRINLNVQLAAVRDSPSLVISRFRNHLEHHSAAQIIYKDGSKNDSGVGCAIAVVSASYSWCMSPKTSVYTAEQYAIWQAMMYCKMVVSARNIVIVSDSLFALTSLRNVSINDPVVQMILESLKVLEESGKNVFFVWVPGHCGVPGNGLADRAARQAATPSAPHCTVDVPLIKVADQKRHTNHRIRSAWQNSWDGLSTQLTEKNPFVQPRFSLRNMCREKRAKVHRLRFGHTALTHLFLLLGNDPPLCQRCGAALVVRHLLCECPILASLRRNFDLPDDLKTCLNDLHSIERVLSYLKGLGIYWKL
nr:unnamed protein product [Callosobruchus analis]